MKFIELLTILGAAAFFPALVMLIYFLIVWPIIKYSKPRNFYFRRIREPKEFIILMCFATLALFVALLIKKSYGITEFSFTNILLIAIIAGFLYHFFMRYVIKDKHFINPQQYVARDIIFGIGFALLLLASTFYGRNLILIQCIWEYLDY